MLETGLMVTIIGMGVVFIFLTILVGAMNITAKIMTVVNRYFPEPVKETIMPAKNNCDEEIAVAIAAAKVLG